MKKVLNLLLLVASFALNAQAQLANGYYRIQNTYTDRYISIEDNNSANYPINKTTGSIDMSGIKTYKPGQKVTTSPSTILYISNVSGKQYDIVGQGTSIHYISGGRIFINLDLQSDGSYQAYGQYSGLTLYLKDDSDASKEEAYLKPNSKSEKAMNWWARKVDTNTEFLGILPDIELNGKYYGTIFASFPFKLVSSGMKAYVATSVSGDGFELKEISGDIPGNTPVIIECSSNNPSENIVMPVESDAELDVNNVLYGTYCDRVSTRYWNVTIYDPTCMRTLSKHNGKLAFKKASASDLTQGTYLKANKAYLLVPTTSPDVLVLGGGGGGGDQGGGGGTTPTTFTVNGATFTIGANNMVTMDNAGNVEGPYEIPQYAQNPNNGQNYAIVAVGEGAFENQTGLTGVSIPSSVTSIGKNAFAGCSGLVAIYSFATEPPVLGSSAFDGVDKENCIIHVLDGCEGKYSTAEGWKDFANIWSTGIREIMNEITTDAHWYSLDGREIMQPTKKGIYINNGKKIVIK
jgi:hypothetical protein